MLLVKLTNGPEILIGDGIDEANCLYGIGFYLDRFSVAANILLRITFFRDRVVIQFKDSISPETAVRRAAHAWDNYLSERLFHQKECVAAVGINGLPLEVPPYADYECDLESLAPADAAG